MLTVAGVHSFYGDAHVLHGISLEVPRGSIVTILGRNGAGTTLKTILAIVQARRGRITFAGTPITRLACEEIARLGIAYIPADRGVIPNLTVRENLRLGELGSNARSGSGDRHA